jgi:preprotein translocase subunit SecE
MFDVPLSASTPQRRNYWTNHDSKFAMITRVKNFFNEVKVELQKASWPWDPKEKGFRRYKELTDSTLVVVIAMLLLGGYVALFDFVLVNFVHFFTRLH